jgi:NADH:ubiquinone reductase (H+-translocating)
VLADVQHLDLDGRVVHALAPDGQKLMLLYDSLVVAAGCTDAYFGHDEWAVFAPGLKTLEDAGHLAAISSVPSRWPTWPPTRPNERRT